MVPFPFFYHPAERPGFALLAFESLSSCGETGIRTRDTLLTYTRFPGVPLQPLEHLSLLLSGCKSNTFPLKVMHPQVDFNVLYIFMPNTRSTFRLVCSASSVLLT